MFSSEAPVRLWTGDADTATGDQGASPLTNPLASPLSLRMTLHGLSPDVELLTLAEEAQRTGATVLATRGLKCRQLKTTFSKSSTPSMYASRHSQTWWSPTLGWIFGELQWVEDGHGRKVVWRARGLTAPGQHANSGYVHAAAVSEPRPTDTGLSSHLKRAHAVKHPEFKWV